MIPTLEAKGFYIRPNKPKFYFLYLLYVFSKFPIYKRLIVISISTLLYIEDYFLLIFCNKFSILKNNKSLITYNQLHIYLIIEFY